VKISGYDLGSSEIGNWNIDVHHRLNVQQGILHKGDGTTINLKEIQKTIDIAAGQLGSKRDIYCTTCSQNVEFYTPYSLSINKDGLVFIGDYNYIWMLNNTDVPKRVLELRSEQPYKYYIKNDPMNGNLYVSDVIKRKFSSAKLFDNIPDLKTNFDKELGSGLFCSNRYDEDLDEFEDDCGDGDFVKNMKISHPKGNFLF
jgi:hypothetical protein